eukprot:jgi/Chlat1/5524/Chrsp369S05343
MEALRAASSFLGSTSSVCFSSAKLSSGGKPDLRKKLQQKKASMAAAPPPARATLASEKEEGAATGEMKLWGGRFEEAVCPAVEKYSQSVSFDKKLYKFDIQLSRAHASMLAKQGLLTDSDREAIVNGLTHLEQEIEAGRFNWLSDREDVHMNIEATLTELVGEPAKKLHTARSRNDQVVTDVRLYVRNAIDTTIPLIEDLQRALVEFALKYPRVVVPGYTHLQRAQPLLFQHCLLAYVEQLDRDKGRLLDCRERVNYCPLGACALAGTGLPIDRYATAEALGFTAPLANRQVTTPLHQPIIVDAVSDRDFLIEYLSANAITGIHLSRLGEEWVLWASEEFGYLIPNDSVSTGSSIMPQKKNPDPMELVRGKSARLIGDLVTVMTLVKGLPQAYNRDLQEDKEPLFDSVETIQMTLQVCAEFARRCRLGTDRLARSLGAGHLDATTLADYLVRKGMAFRTSHEVVGKCVAIAVAQRKELSEIPLEELQQVHPIFEEDVYDSLGVKNSIAQFTSYGSTGYERVQEQMGIWQEKLGM